MILEPGRIGLDVGAGAVHEHAVGLGAGQWQSRGGWAIEVAASNIQAAAGGGSGVSWAVVKTVTTHTPRKLAIQKKGGPFGPPYQEIIGNRI